MRYIMAMRDVPGIWTLLALGFLASVWGCDTCGTKGPNLQPQEAGSPEDLQRVDAEIRKTQEAIQRAKVVGTQLRLLWPLYRKCAAFQRDTPPDIAAVLSAAVAGPGESGKAQPAIFHMVNILNDMALAYGSASASIREREIRTHESTAPVVDQLLGLYGTAINEFRDCTEVVQRLQQGDWWCRQDRDFQRYVDQYHLDVSDASGNSCFLIRDAIQAVCGLAYSTIDQANRLYRSE